MFGPSLRNRFRQLFVSHTVYLRNMQLLLADNFAEVCTQRRGKLELEIFGRFLLGVCSIFSIVWFHGVIKL